MAKCAGCLRKISDISPVIGYCRDCLRSNPKYIEQALIHHREWRGRIGLTGEPPRDGDDSVRCRFCVNNCSIPPDSSGYCRIVVNRGGRLTYITGDMDKALLHWYLDPIPTNCVAAHLCPASTGAGYPKYSLREDGEEGYYNLAIFYAGCNLDCLFCQNIEHKYVLSDMRVINGWVKSIDDMLRVASDSRVTCICYFGGDPTPHIIYSLRLSRRIIEEAEENRWIKKIRWETNGLENPRLFEEMARLSLRSGGIVKIDWKAYTPSIYTALTGIDGAKAVERVKENIRIASKYIDERPEVPLLVISTLIIPHYIDGYEVGSMAEYISSINEDIPMVLLGFAPHHLMRDMDRTPWSQMNEAIRAAKSAGVRNIHIGNIWLLKS